VKKKRGRPKRVEAVAHVGSEGEKEPPVEKKRVGRPPKNPPPPATSDEEVEEGLGTGAAVGSPESDAAAAEGGNGVVQKKRRRPPKTVDLNALGGGPKRQALEVTTRLTPPPPEEAYGCSLPCPSFPNSQGTTDFAVLRRAIPILCTSQSEGSLNTECSRLYPPPLPRGKLPLQHQSFTVAM